MEITLKLTAEPKLMGFLDLLSNALSVNPKPAQTPVDPKPTERAKDVENTASADEPGKASVSVEMVRKAVMAQSQAGKRDEIKALLAEFKAKRVTDLDSSQYADFLQKVNAL